MTDVVEAPQLDRTSGAAPDVAPNNSSGKPVVASEKSPTPSQPQSGKITFLQLLEDSQQDLYKNTKVIELADKILGLHTDTRSEILEINSISQMIQGADLSEGAMMANPTFKSLVEKAQKLGEEAAELQKQALAEQEKLAKQQQNFFGRAIGGFRRMVKIFGKPEDKLQKIAEKFQQVAGEFEEAQEKINAEALEFIKSKVIENYDKTATTYEEKAKELSGEAVDIAKTQAKKNRELAEYYRNNPEKLNELFEKHGQAIMTQGNIGQMAEASDLLENGSAVMPVMLTMKAALRIAAVAENIEHVVDGSENPQHLANVMRYSAMPIELFKRADKRDGYDKTADLLDCANKIMVGYLHEVRDSLATDTALLADITHGTETLARAALSITYHRAEAGGKDIRQSLAHILDGESGLVAYIKKDFGNMAPNDLAFEDITRITRRFAALSVAQIMQSCGEDCGKAKDSEDIAESLKKMRAKAGTEDVDALKFVAKINSFLGYAELAGISEEAVINEISAVLQNSQKKESEAPLEVRRSPNQKNGAQDQMAAAAAQAATEKPAVLEKVA
jgi:hypothetical protein